MRVWLGRVGLGEAWFFGRLCVAVMVDMYIGRHSPRCLPEKPILQRCSRPSPLELGCFTHPVPEIAMPKQELVPTTEIPQANSLANVRRAAWAVSQGADTGPHVARLASLPIRAAGYALSAARILGFIEAGSETVSVTQRGDELLKTPEGSDSEAALFFTAIRNCAPLSLVVGDLFEPDLTQVEIARRLEDGTPLSGSTAMRRAQSLTSWRRQILDPRQLPLLQAPVTSVAPSTVVSSMAPSTVVSSKPVTRQSSPPLTAAPAHRAPRNGPLLDSNATAYLHRHLARGTCILFTGAGFSFDATDLDGNPLPLGRDLASELWDLCYPDVPFDETVRLPELFSVALRQQRKSLELLLRRRLRVGKGALPDHYRHWFSAPWRRVYTLNVDDLEQAAQLRFDLPRQLRTVSALHGSREDTSLHPSAPDLPVIHLNGCVTDGPELVTFSVQQYSRRVGEQEPHYAQLASDLLFSPTVFVGSELDEGLIWQHIEMRGHRAATGERENRPRSFLVTPKLSLPRQSLLQEHNIQWVQATAAEFADEVLGPASEPTRLGLLSLEAEAKHAVDSPDNVKDVGSILNAEPARKTDYLMGAEPRWSDLRDGRAVQRDIDVRLSKEAIELLHAGRIDVGGERVAPVILLSGTAGSGKSTTIMRLCMDLSHAGYSVGWVGMNTEVSPRNLVKLAQQENTFNVIAIDDARRYGTTLPNLVQDVSGAEEVQLVVLTMRASHAVRMDEDDMVSANIIPHSMPFLSEGDVGVLLDVLHREHRLGALKGLSREMQEQAFMKRAGRQLLVAMIEATSGERFDEKVVGEWEDLPARAQYFYSLITVATALHYPIRRQELLAANPSSRNPADLRTLTALGDKHLIVVDGDGTYRSRHKVIADKLMDYFRGRRSILLHCFQDLAFVVASGVTSDLARSSRPWRFLKRLLSHRFLFSHLGVDDARLVYEHVEELLHWDHHYLLQRGSLEVKEGDIRLAEQFINQAHGLRPSDQLVVTEYAYMRMKKAISSVGHPDAQTWFLDAVELLRGQIATRGRTDFYPYHVLGTQTLTWIRRSRWPQDERKHFLKDICAQVQDGLRLNPGSPELHDLEQSLRRAVLETTLG